MHVVRRVLWSGLGLLAMGRGPAARADTRIVVEKVCPISLTKFKATLAGSGFQATIRLDARPVGAIASPWPLPVCPECGFVLFKRDNQEYTADEMTTLRSVVESPEYKGLPTKDSSYLRLAKLYEGLKRSPEEVDHAYLKASWQVESDEPRNRALLATSLEWFEKFLASGPKKDQGWQSAEVLRGELQRCLGKFAEAKAQFDRLKGMKEFEQEPFPRVIAQEGSLIDAKDPSPRELSRRKE